MFYVNARLGDRRDLSTGIFSYLQGIPHQSPTDMQGELYKWSVLIIMPLPWRGAH